MYLAQLQRIQLIDAEGLVPTVCMIQRECDREKYIFVKKNK